MNPKQLDKLGVPKDCIPKVIGGIHKASKAGELRNLNIKKLIPEIMASPEVYVDDIYFGEFAQEFIIDKNFVQKSPVPYSYWGKLDDNVKHQIELACSLPNAVQVSLMADSHYCDPVPVGAVVALEDAVCTEIVSSDISCMMYLSILDMPLDSIKKKFNLYKEAIEKSTRFGFDEHEKPMYHSVLDQDWNITKVTREHKDRAHRQLGSSGSSNHFIDFGIVTFNNPGMPQGEHVAILSHSGSRGTGAAVAGVYGTIAQRRRPARYSYLKRLSWLDANTQERQEYWQAMNLMGDYATANHEVIHNLLVKNIGAEVLCTVQNKHNFAWKEKVGDKELYVHRKGATPAGKGMIGIIPGSMASPAFIVVGKGNELSINSASHGAGRLMSRTAARAKYNWNAVLGLLADKDIQVISAGVDECPYAYKPIEEVMASQSDLVDVAGIFQPKIIKMAPDLTKSWQN